jgi:lysyl-tRNA synthetase class II
MAVTVIRNFLEKAGDAEVSRPVVFPITSGIAARPDFSRKHATFFYQCADYHS